MRAEHGQHLTGRDVPQADAAVDPAGRQHGAIGRESCAEQQPLVAGKPARDCPQLNIPQHHPTSCRLEVSQR